DYMSYTSSKRAIAASLAGALALTCMAPAIARADEALIAQAEPVEMHRLYNPNSGEHFYTSSDAECEAVAEEGWRYEGVGWIAPSVSEVPVYRLYNPNAGDHHYTTSEGERDLLVVAGWSFEGIGWYSDSGSTVAVFRQYNPNARSGAHNFTTSAGENESLAQAGWNKEGIAWYALKAGYGFDKPGLELNYASGSTILSATLTRDGNCLPGGLEYQARDSQGGWTDWTPEGVEAVTASPLTAARFKLTGMLSNAYDIWARAKVEGVGWTGWARNGDAFGSEWERTVESIEVMLVARGSAAPGSTENALWRGSLYDMIREASSDVSITSFGGFSLSAAGVERIQQALDELATTDNTAGFLMMDLRTGKGVAYDPDKNLYGASSIKALYIGSVVAAHPEAVRDHAEDIQEVCLNSSNDHYKWILADYGKDPLRAWCAETGAKASIAENLPWDDYTPRDMALLWARIYLSYGESAECEQFGQWSQTPVYSAIHGQLGDRFTTRSKGGWIDDGGKYYQVTNDAGIVYADNGPYVVSIMSDLRAQMSRLYNLVEAINAAHAEI
ncbi:MAG: serine hydrolase, partial [Coriobacteriales bacterium]|nr:serine hydrolase [Coriobacteriales bacterium]